MLIIIAWKGGEGGFVRGIFPTIMTHCLNVGVCGPGHLCECPYCYLLRYLFEDS